MKKVYMWGTGRLAGKVLDVYYPAAGIEGFIDNDCSKHIFMEKEVIRPETLREREYDAVLIANLYGEQIKKQSEDIGLDVDKFIFLYENSRIQDMNKDYGFVAKILGESYAKKIKDRYHLVRGLEMREKLCLEGAIGGYMATDYVRMKCFELAVRELKKRNVEGAVAEVGVFRGEFAQYVNYAFPDRKCYLFDTFEGFRAEEALEELKKGNCSAAFVQAYSNTDIRAVLGKMTRLEQVVIKQGLFPDSLEGMEERFAFVSVDVDFEESIYQALHYFYPRLNAGGYLFVHDYNSLLSGVETAVDRFEKEQGEFLARVPICDANGTLVITK